MIEYIVKSLKKRKIELDSGQLNLIHKMIESIQPEKDLTSKLENKSTKKCFYIWGKVGRGKTLITKTFFNLLTERKASFHYMEFMQTIHDELLDLSGKKNPLNIIARSLSRKCKLIFIDEFQVEDITDAMIIGNLINQLIKLNVTIYLTSNTHPDNLYKNGLQREVFINEMKIMQELVTVHEIEGAVDYRSRNIVNLNQDDSDKYYNDNDIILFLKNNFENLDFNREYYVNSRMFSCKATSSDFLWISFSDFFKEPSGDKEYIEISEKTEWIFINDFIICNDDYADVVRRFISFIDICYRNKIKVKFFFNKYSCNDLYTGDKLKELWERCSSRLNEMQTIEYLT
ncbi:cell division protein ZapE [Gammaproteobacteria bacterium]|nr:cell division protein ZapE [Gammaproteobacteria bacterium]